MISQKNLFSIGKFDFKFNHFLIILILSLSFTISFLLRSLPVEYGWELHEFDPFFNYRATEYIVNNGILEYFDWNDSLSWYPNGRDVSSNSQVMLHLTAAVSYWILGGGGNLYSYTIIFPAIVGSLSCIIIFALIRTISGTTAGLFGSLFFAVSIPVLVRGQIGWFKSEPLGLFFGLLATYLFLSGIKSHNSSSYLRIFFASILFIVGFSSWGGTLFFIIPISVTICLLPFVRSDQNFLIKSISLFTAAIILSSLFFERLSSILIFNMVGFSLISSSIVMGLILIVQKRSSQKNLYGVITLVSILILSITLLLILEHFQITSLPTHRYLNSVIPLLTTTDPLTDSVAEHATLELSHSFLFHSVLMIFASIGIWFLFTKNKLKNLTNDMKIYTLVIGLFAVYIGSAFMRLEIFTSIGIILLSSIGISILIKSSFIKKSNISILTISSFLIVLLLVPLFLPAESNVIKISSSTPPTIKNGGTSFAISSNDWRESLEWVKFNTPDDSVIGSWWDYGYWIQTIANRASLTDNSTTIHHRIISIAKIFFESPDDAWKSLNQMETDYFIIFIAAEKIPFQTQNDEDLYVLRGGGDESKRFWFAQIAGIDMNNYFYDDKFSGKQEFWDDTFLGKMMPYEIFGYVDIKNDRFSEEYVSGWVGLYTKKIKFTDENDPFHLVYSSSSYDDSIENKVIGVFVYEVNPEYIPISEEWESPWTPEPYATNNPN